MTSLTEKHGCEIETNAVGFNSNDVIRIFGKDENESRKKNLGEKQILAKCQHVKNFPPEAFRWRGFEQK